MLGMDIPVRAPTSFLFFAASGFAAYFSGEIPALRWWSYSAFSLFIALGPARWTETCLYNFHIKRWTMSREEWATVGEVDGLIITIGWVSGIVQLILFAIGSYFGLHGLLELQQDSLPAPQQ